MSLTERSRIIANSCAPLSTATDCACCPAFHESKLPSKGPVRLSRWEQLPAAALMDCGSGTPVNGAAFAACVACAAGSVLKAAAAACLACRHNSFVISKKLQAHTDRRKGPLLGRGRQMHPVALRRQVQSSQSRNLVLFGRRLGHFGTACSLLSQ